MAPRVVIVFVASNTAMGFAYRTGLVRRVDDVALKIIFIWDGHLGVGVFMPEFEKYRVTIIKTAVGLTAGLLYDCLDRLYV